MKRFISWTIFFTAFIGVALSAYGCKTDRPTPAIATGEAIARANVRNDSAAYHVQKVTPKVKGAERAHLETAEVDLDAQKADLAEARKKNEATAADYAAQHDELTRIKQGLFYRIGVWAARLWKWLLGLFLGSLLLRGIALAMPGPVGGILSLISTGIMGILSGGLSVIQSLFDNIYFRKVAPAEKLKAIVDTGGGVSTTTTSAGTVTVVGDATGSATPTTPVIPDPVPAADL